MPAPDYDGLFEDRADAGRRLGDVLRGLVESSTIVLGVARGGVPVAHQVAAALDLRIGVVVAVRIGIPRLPEVALGAVVEGKRFLVSWDEDLLAAAGLETHELDEAAARAIAEVERRRSIYRIASPDLPVANRHIVVVDDGIASGTTIKAVLRAIRRRRPARLSLAVPVASQAALDELASGADDLVCLIAPSPPGFVGAFYRSFKPVTDEHVVALIGQPRAGP